MGLADKKKETKIVGNCGRNIEKVGKEDKLVSTPVPQAAALGSSFLPFSHPSDNSITVFKWLTLAVGDPI